MNPEVEPLKSDVWDNRMKFRLGKDLTMAIRQTAKDLGAEEEFVLERIIFEFLYGTLCLRCGEANLASTQFCRRCGEDFKRDEEEMERMQGMVRVDVVSEEGSEEVSEE